MNTEIQQKKDSFLANHAALQRNCWAELSRMQLGGVGRFDANNLAPENQTAIKDGWANRATAPNDWAIDQLARMVVDKSAALQDAGWRVDQTGTLLFATMLRHVVAQYVTTLYIPNQTRELFPVDGSVPPGATTYTHMRLFYLWDDDLGYLAPQGGKLKEVNVEAEEDERNLASFGHKFSYSLEQLERAAFAQRPLQPELMIAANEKAELTFDTVSLFGYAEKGIVGAYKDGNVGVVVPITGAWAGATHDQIVADIRFLIESVYLQTGPNRALRPSRLIVPSVLWTFMAVKRGTESDTNVLQAIQADYPGISVMESTRADLYDAANTGPRLMALTPSTAYLKIIEARRFQLEAPQLKDFTFEVPGRQRIGGASVNVPLTVGYMDGC